MYPTRSRSLRFFAALVLVAGSQAVSWPQAGHAQEAARTITKWPDGQPAVVQYWQGQRHVRDEHLDKGGKKSLEASYDPDGLHIYWRQFRPDGTVSATWTTVQGKRDGEEQGLDSEGKVIRVVPWRDGKRHGIIRDLDADGHVLGEVPYAEDQPVGPLVTYYVSGERRSVCPLVDHVRHGTEQIWHKEGWKQAEATWRFGQLDGTTHYFAQDGTLLADIHWTKGLADGPEVQYYPSKKRKAVIPLTPEGVRHGTGVWYDEAGVKVAERPYVAGKLNGWDRRWDTYGAKVAEVQWTDDQPCCAVRNYWPSGAIKSELSYVNMALDGSETDFFDKDPGTGAQRQKQMTVGLVKGAKSGYAVVYDRAGNRWSELDFVDDRREGVETRFYPSGQRQAEYRWRSDRLVGVAQTWWPNGQLQSQFPADDGAGTGTERRWDATGHLRMELPLVKGKKHGLGRVLADDGSLAATQTWVDDVLNGPEVRYRDGKAIGTWEWKDGELVSSPPPEVERKVARPATVKPGEGLRVEGVDDEKADPDVVREAAREAAQQAAARQGPPPEAPPQGSPSTDPKAIAAAQKAAARTPLPNIIRTFWPNGKLQSVYPRIGKGTEVQFHDNGEVSLIVPVVAGIRVGLARIFDRGGVLVAKVAFVDGQKDGEETQYARSGERVGTRHWQRGKPIGIARTWYPDGTLQSEYHHDPTQPSGVEIQYHRNGVVRVYVPLRFGRRNGTATIYTEAGVKWAEVSWRDGKRQGEERRFDKRGVVIARLWWSGDKEVAPPPEAQGSQPAAEGAQK